VESKEVELIKKRVEWWLKGTGGWGKWGAVNQLTGASYGDLTYSIGSDEYVD
jgi:hypothetical protein